MTRSLAPCVAFALATCLASGCSQRGTPPPASVTDTQAKLAPGFAGATSWLNVDHPLTMAELKGKVVVVDFWTSCCINCIHTLPVLTAIEHRYAGQPVVVIGVHSPKFDAETEADRLRAITTQYSIHHPIAVDGSMKLWNAWGAKAWPTVIVLDPQGRMVWTDAGEPTKSAIEGVVDATLATGKKDGTLSDRPLTGVRPEHDDSGPLSFPSKVLALGDGSLAVADSGHHRVVLLDEGGTTRAVIGSGLAGFTDGGYAEASFRRPQGLAIVGEVLYVADTENHAIRAVDLRARTVTTVAGTGELGAGPIGDASPAKETKLRSPWDLVAVGDAVYVALAGSHQIGVLTPSTGTIAAFAGDGQERRKDGVGRDASFAQPSGLTTDGKSLYVADSETSSVRAISLATRDVKTIVGRDLFVFGDVDGPGAAVRLEHPLGIAWGGGALWVADTYNSKIKRVDPATGETRTLTGGRDHSALFEPEGLAIRGAELIVADTKHHRIELIATKGGAPRTHEIAGLAIPTQGVAVTAPAANATSGDRVTLGDVPLARSGPTEVHFDWQAPAGTGVNDEAPFRVEWTSSDGLAAPPAAVRTKGAAVQHGFDVTVTPIPGAEGGRLEGEMSVVLCDTSTHRVCVPVRRTLELTFRVATSAADERRVMIPLPEAKP